MSAKPRYRVRAGGHLGVVINMAEYVPEPDEDVLTAVEQLANLALNEDVVGIAVALVHGNGATNNFYVKGPCRATLVGATFRLMSRIQADEPN